MAAISALTAFVSLPLALDHHLTPPAAEQAAEWVRAHHEPETTAIMGTRSTRFFQETGAPFTVRGHSTLAEVVVDLSRFDRFPKTILLTSEVDLHSGGGPTSPLPARWHIEEGQTFCRDARIDRAQPCLTLSELTWSPR